MSPFSLSGALRFILDHPLNRHRRLAALWDLLRWQVRSRLARGPVVVDFVGGSRLSVRRGQTAGTGNIYTGLVEYEDMLFLLHYLRPGDHFVDVGANIGTFTILAAAVVGSKALSLEPVPDTFDCLRENIALNGCEARVTLIQAGAGSRGGRMRMTTHLGSGNHVLAPGEAREDATEVAIHAIDELTADIAPALLKIDVEGYETEVIAGAERLLGRESLKAVIIELNGSGTKLGYDEQAIHERLLEQGLAPYLYDPLTRTLAPLDGIRPDYRNTLYVRDLESVRERLLSGPPVAVHGLRI